VSISKSRDMKYSASVGSNVSYNHAYSTLSNYFSNQYLSVLVNFNLDLFLPGKFQIHTDGSMVSRQQVGGFETVPTVYFLNAWAGKKMLKKENLLIKASANNILNTNAMNSRISGAGFVSQTTYNVIERYFLLTVTWNFLSTRGK
jgi:hypothetical protein